MFKYVLVPATGADTDEPVFATALLAARLLSGHIEFLHVRMDTQAALTAMATADMGGGLGYDKLLQALEHEAAARQRRAELAFRDFCEREKLRVTADPLATLPSAEWRLETGDECYWLAEHARAADLLVLGRPGDGEAVAFEKLEAGLMATGRPILLAPARPPRRLSGTVAIAWKDRPEAARSVADAEPFLRAASNVLIISVAEDVEADGQACERLRHSLSWHNANVRVQCLKREARPPVDTLLAAAAAADADLLVMGGYGHSRVRETIFGGFTRRILSDAGLPVLMAH